MPGHLAATRDDAFAPVAQSASSVLHACPERGRKAVGAGFSPAETSARRRGEHRFRDACI